LVNISKDRTKNKTKSYLHNKLDIKIESL
jgi:hypothetical protein